MTIKQDMEALAREDWELFKYFYQIITHIDETGGIWDGGPLRLRFPGDYDLEQKLVNYGLMEKVTGGVKITRIGWGVAFQLWWHVIHHGDVDGFVPDFDIVIKMMMVIRELENKEDVQ